MNEMPAYQVILNIVANDPTDSGELDATAEAVLEGVLRDTAFVALGPVVSVDHAQGVIELECTISSESSEDVHEKMARITHAMLEAANSFEYQGSTAKKLEPALV